MNGSLWELSSNGSPSMYNIIGIAGLIGKPEKKTRQVCIVGKALLPATILYGNHPIFERWNAPCKYDEDLFSPRKSSRATHKIRSCRLRPDIRSKYVSKMCVLALSRSRAKLFRSQFDAFHDGDSIPQFMNWFKKKESVYDIDPAPLY